MCLLRKLLLGMLFASLKKKILPVWPCSEHPSAQYPPHFQVVIKLIAGGGKMTCLTDFQKTKQANTNDNSLNEPKCPKQNP
jgi:hypothetical protein